MKAGIKTHMKVRFSISLNAVSKIEFIFKNKKSYDATTLKYEVWTADGSDGSCRRVPGTEIILVPWEKEETYAFSHDFFMDTRVFFKKSSDNPETKIVPLHMEPTLFERDPEDD